MKRYASITLALFSAMFAFNPAASAQYLVGSWDCRLTSPGGEVKRTNPDFRLAQLG